MPLNALRTARHNFALRRPLAGVVAAFLLCAACASDGTDDATPQENPDEIASDELVRDKLVALGFERSEIEVDGPYARVDDVVYYRDLLLRGAYDAPAGDSSGASDKAYRISVAGVLNPAISVANRPRIKFTFSTVAGEVVSAEHKAAVRRAATDWSNAGSSIRITEGIGNPQITVREIPWQDWAARSGCSASSLACVDAPLNGAPSRNMWIKSKINPFFNPPPACEWSTGSRRQNGFHELGHAIGFHHPKATGSTHIPGTAVCPNAEATCLFTAGYNTVMTGITYRPGTCEPFVSVLQFDDITAVRLIYPP